MPARMKIILAGLAVGLLFAAMPSAAQSTEEEAWKAFMTPGAAHGYMAQFVGRWDIETRFWHAPGQAPEITRGRADYDMILGGRYLRSRYTGISMGQAFEGMGLEAFDNAKKEYVSVWVDSMSTGVVTATGQLQADGKTIVYLGTRTDPLTGNDIDTRSVWKQVDDNRWVFEMFDLINGREVQIMVMTATRP